MNVNKKLSNIIFMAAFALFTWMWSDKYDGVITSVLGGIETESDIIDILGLGKWLFLFAVYFLILNKMLVDNRKTLLFTLYRYRDFKSWWKQYFLRLHITMFLYYLISCIVWYVIGVVTDNSSSHTVEIMIIFYMHLAMYFSIIAEYYALHFDTDRGCDIYHICAVQTDCTDVWHVSENGAYG